MLNSSARNCIFSPSLIRLFLVTLIIGNRIPAVLSIEVKGAARRHFGDVEKPAMLQLDANLQRVISQDAAQVVGHGINIFNGSLCNAAVAGIRDAGDIHCRNTEIYRIDAAGQVLDSEFLNRITAGVDRHDVMDGAVVTQFEFVDLSWRDRESALDRDVLSSLWIIGLRKRTWRYAASVVPDITLKERVAS